MREEDINYFKSSYNIKLLAHSQDVYVPYFIEYERFFILFLILNLVYNKKITKFQHQITRRKKIKDIWRQ